MVVPAINQNPMQPCVVMRLMTQVWWNRCKFHRILGTAWGQDWSTGNFQYAQAIAISPNSGDLFVADSGNHKIVVLDRNGSIKREFGSNGSAPGQFQFYYYNQYCDLAFLSDGTLVIADQNYLHFYDEDGTFLSRTNVMLVTMFRWHLTAPFIQIVISGKKMELA